MKKKRTVPHKKGEEREKHVIKNLLNGIDTGNFKPYIFEIHPTSRCNLRCRFCATHGRKVTQDAIPDKKLLELINEAADLGAGHCLVIGDGEPFIRREIVTKLL